MKFAPMVEYGPDHEKTKALHPSHREYLRSLLEDGTLQAAGPFTQSEGALWILDAETIQAAKEMIRADPFVAAGVIVSWKVRPLAYWSAKEAKGSR